MTNQRKDVLQLWQSFSITQQLNYQVELRLNLLQTILP